MTDQIIIDGIQAMAFIGVPDEERAKLQKIEISLVLHVDFKMSGIADNIKQTVDYFQVHQKTLAIVAQKPRKLIETLAEDIAAAHLRVFKDSGLEKIQVEVKKFVLENTNSVSVHITREIQK